MATLPVTIEHRITAGSQFDATVPSTTPAAASGINVFPTATAGGFFVFGYTSQWLYEVQRISGDFADAATVSIRIRNDAGDDVSIYEGLVGGDVLITDRFQLAPDEQIVIITTGASAAMMARVIARPLLSAASP